MDDRPLDHALKPGRGLGILVAVADQVLELALEIGRKPAPELVQVHIACPHHGGGVLVIQQRQQQMLERGIFVMPLVCERKRPVQGLFEIARERGHVRPRGNA